MITKNLSGKSNWLRQGRYVLLCTFFVGLCQSSQLFAQRMLIGLKGGVNYTQADPTKSFSSVVFTQAPLEDTHKRVYSEQFDNRGTQFGIALTFEYTNFFGVSFEPTYSQYNYGFKNSYLWQATEGFESVAIEYNHNQKLNYIELPLFFRFSFSQGPVIPYLQVGGFYNVLQNASKSVNTTQLDLAAGGFDELNGDENDVGITHLMDNKLYGLAGAVGISINLPHVRVSLEGAYRYGMNNVANEYTRYSDPRSSTIHFDVLDDTSLRNMQFSLVCHFPINFGMGGNGTKNTRYVVPYDMRRFKDEGSRK